MNRLILLILVFLGSHVSALSQNISRKEKKILATIEANNSEALQFLEEVINMNSGTMNLKGVKEVGMVFKKEFEAIGFKAEWIEMPQEMERAGHLFAETEGEKGKKLLLIGHIDTVFEKDSPFQKFKMVKKY